MHFPNVDTFNPAVRNFFGVMRTLAERKNAFSFCHYQESVRILGSVFTSPTRQEFYMLHVAKFDPM